MSTYITIQGDKWDLIALRAYGTTSFIDTLMTANTQHIGTYLFPAGISITIPDIDLDSATNNANLPPWKQVEA